MGLALALAAYAAYAAWWEAGPFINGGQTSEQTAQQIVLGTLKAGLSEESQQIVVEDCVSVLNSFYALTRPTEDRDALALSCRHLIEESVAAMPSFSFGWYGLAVVDAVLDADPAIFDTDLARSQQTGPYEQWIAELRVALAEEHLTALSPATLTGHEADLRMLVQSRRGIATIARRYVNDASFRERITRIVETLPREAQLAFLDEVRQAANIS